MSRKYRKKLNIAALACVLAMTFSGCGTAAEDGLVPAGTPEYNAVVPKVAEVVRGDLTPQFSAKLDLLGYEQSRYQISSAQYEELFMLYNMVIDEIPVGVGDHVNAGDVLVAFHSDVLDKQIEENEKKITEANLEIENLRRISSIDSGEDHSADISRLNREIEVARLYISDIRETYNKLNIVSKVDGYVSYVNAVLSDGYIIPGQDMVVVDQSRRIYAMDPSELYSFKPGETFTATNGTTPRKLQVVETPEGETGNKVYFEPVDADGEMLDKSLKLEFELPEMKDVCYVNHLAIYKKDDKYYAYVVREDGMRNVVEVTPGDTVGNDIIIKEGLSGGEQLEMP